MKLVISLPTRGRPQKLLETIRVSCSNLVLDNTVMLVHVDEDDIETKQALADSWSSLDKHVRVTVAPREDTIGAKWNRALKEPGDLYLVDADDAPWVTPGYDAKLLEAAARFPDGIGAVYGHLANASFPGVMGLTAKLCEKFGNRMFVEFFPYWFVDHWVDDIVRHLGRISFAEVRTDQTTVGQTQEMREPAWWATWFDAAYLVRRQIAHGIIDDADFQEPAWRKEMLKAQAPLIEDRSRWINDNVRAMQQWPVANALSLKDGRYQRLKKQAIELVEPMLVGMPNERAPRILGPWGAIAYRNYLTPPTRVAGIRQTWVA